MTKDEVRKLAIRSGCNTGKALAHEREASLYGHQMCLYRAAPMEAEEYVRRVTLNIQSEGGQVLKFTCGMKIYPKYDQWSILWWRIRVRMGENT